ncbi:histidine phosphatase family protein [Lactovum miscens]
MMKIYLVRHGKTMFNTIGRAQGWSDTPLTKQGELCITELGLGFAEKGIKFDRAYSSDSGRTIQTINLILKNSANEGIPYKMDWRIREWCFGSFDGAYDGELFDGLIPRFMAENGITRETRTTKDICEAIYEVDTAGWAETWEALIGRISTGFKEIAEEAEATGAKNIVIVSHGMTIGTFVEFLEPKRERPMGLDNGSVSEINYENGKFSIETVGDMSYCHIGQTILNNK